MSIDVLYICQVFSFLMFFFMKEIDAISEVPIDS